MNKLRDRLIARRIYSMHYFYYYDYLCVAIITTPLLLTTAFNQCEQKVAIRRVRVEFSSIEWTHWWFYWNRQGASGIDGKRRRKMMMNKSFVSWCVCICVHWPVLTMHWQKWREKKKKNRSLAPRSVSLPYVWLNTDIYEKRTEEQKKKGTVLFFLLLP
jgi:hypothetical protein